MLTEVISYLILLRVADLLVEERPAACQIMLLLEEGGPRPLTFVLNANLLVNVKLTTCMSFDQRINEIYL